MTELIKGNTCTVCERAQQGGDGSVGSLSDLQQISTHQWSCLIINPSRWNLGQRPSNMADGLQKTHTSGRECDCCGETLSIFKIYEASCKAGGLFISANGLLCVIRYKTLKNVSVTRAEKVEWLFAICQSYSWLKVGMVLKNKPVPIFSFLHMHTSLDHSLILPVYVSFGKYPLVSLYIVPHLTNCSNTL